MARLATKITVPFVALFTLLLAILGFVLTRAIFSEVEAQVERQLRLVLSIAQFELLPPQPTFLRKLLKSASGEPDRAGMELIVMRDAGEPLTTLDAGDAVAAQLLEDLDTRAKDASLFPGLEGLKAAEETQITRCHLAGKRYLVLYRSGISRDKTWNRYFLIYPQARIDAAQDRAMYRIMAFGGLGVLLAALLGRIVAHFITRPVRRLAATAGRLSAGGLSESLDPEAVVSRDEIGDLTRAFRTMVESLRQSQKEKLQAERLAAAGKLAASVAHEIRNPLTSLRMTVQMLVDKHGNGDDATREAYEVILGEIDRLSLSVDELLTIARPRAPRLEPSDLGALVCDTVAFLERQLKHAKVSVRIEGATDLPTDIPLDTNKIRQLLVNLLLNAMQAIVRNGIITVRIKLDASRNVACLEVSDDGPGIPEDVRDQVFELFVSTKDGGGGLGLAVAKQVVQEHGGTIAFDTSEKGTTFRIELPVGRSPS